MERVGVASLVMLFIFIMFPLLIGVYAINEEGDALYAFKKKLTDPKGVLDSWKWKTRYDTCAAWFYVTCNTDNQVTSVDLKRSHLSGQLVPELGKLKNLQYLGLHNNNISGSIPKELGNLTNLVKLDLHNNSLTGPIPEELGNLKNLEFLLLNDNNLSGRVPIEAIHKILPHLKVMNISNNPYLCSNPSCP